MRVTTFLISIVFGFVASILSAIFSSIPLPTIPWNGLVYVTWNLTVCVALPIIGVIQDIREGYGYMIGVFFGGLYTVLYTPLWMFGLLPIGEFILFLIWILFSKRV